MKSKNQSSESVNESDSIFSQIDTPHMDYSQVKLQVDEVDLEELEDEKQKRKMFEETNRAVKESFKIRMQIMQWQ